MMNGRSRNHEDVYQNKMLLDLNEIGKEEKELELRLGPPGDEQDWSQGHNENTYKRERDDSSSLCFGYFSSHIVHHQQHYNQNKAKGKDSSPFLELQSSKQNMTVLGKESKDATQPSCPKVDEKKPFSPSFANTNIPNSSQKRTNAPGPVVGWPPIHSSRKNNNNIASVSSSKHKYHGPHQHHLHIFPNKSANNDKEHVQNNATEKGLFVKINMDGVPIGRKVDINACGSYQKLSHVVDDLFRDLLAAQRDSCGGGVQRRREEQEKLSDQGNDEYTLAFEDHEGHNMLVRDVPWKMFVSTVKRLRVLKSSDLSSFSLGSKQMHTNK